MTGNLNPGNTMTRCSEFMFFLPQTGKLSPEEFRNWAEQHSYILDIIFGHKSFTDKQKVQYMQAGIVYRAL